MNIEAITVWLSVVGYKISKCLTAIFDRDGRKDEWVV